MAHAQFIEVSRMSDRLACQIYDSASVLGHMDDALTSLGKRLLQRIFDPFVLRVASTLKHSSTAASMLKATILTLATSKQHRGHHCQRLIIEYMQALAKSRPTHHMSFIITANTTFRRATC